MYNFQRQQINRKRFGKVKKGWHAARVHQATLKIAKDKKPRQYIGLEYEIIHEEEYRDILVRGFFNYNNNGKPDPRFLYMGETAGLSGNYGNDVNAVLHDLIGRELMVYVVHRFRNRQRRDKVVDFKPMPHDSINVSSVGQPAFLP